MPRVASRPGGVPKTPLERSVAREEDEGMPVEARRDAVDERCHLNGRAPGRRTRSVLRQDARRLAEIIEGDGRASSSALAPMPTRWRNEVEPSPDGERGGREHDGFGEVEPVSGERAGYVDRCFVQLRLLGTHLDPTDHSLPWPHDQWSIAVESSASAAGGMLELILGAIRLAEAARPCILGRDGESTLAVR